MTRAVQEGRRGTMAPLGATRETKMSTHEFLCPACAAVIRLAGEELVEGNEIVCGECGEQFVASREYDEPSGSVHWSLVVPEVDLED